MATPGIPDGYDAHTPSHRYDRTDDLLKKIAGLLTALALLTLLMAILLVIGLVGANQTSDEISDRLDDIRQNTATP